MRPDTPDTKTKYPRTKGNSQPSLEQGNSGSSHIACFSVLTASVKTKVNKREGENTAKKEKKRKEKTLLLPCR